DSWGKTALGSAGRCALAISEARRYPDGSGRDPPEKAVRRPRAVARPERLTGAHQMGTGSESAKCQSPFGEHLLSTNACQMAHPRFQKFMAYQRIWNLGYAVCHAGLSSWEENRMIDATTRIGRSLKPAVTSALFLALVAGCGGTTEETDTAVTVGP